MLFFKKKEKMTEFELEDSDTQVVAFNIIGEDDNIYGFNMTCRKLYHAKEDEEKVDFSVDMVSKADIEALISMLTKLKEHA